MCGPYAAPCKFFTAARSFSGKLHIAVTFVWVFCTQWLNPTIRIKIEGCVVPGYENTHIGRMQKHIMIVSWRVATVIYNFDSGQVVYYSKVKINVFFHYASRYRHPVISQMYDV